MNDYLNKIDRDKFIYKNDPSYIYAEKEMIRSHDLSLKISDQVIQIIRIF